MQKEGVVFLVVTFSRYFSKRVVDDQQKEKDN
jgi:hypothetical protein